ncbi:hypothetical protein MFRU_009g03130 [Monilinia fructicola]|nr:hypothetical protein MFRU_009g03130 [Monilinia fructicola]
MEDSALSPTTNSGAAPGPLVQLRGLSLSSLPQGGIGIRENGELVPMPPQPLGGREDESQAHTMLKPFIRNVLTDAVSWLSGDMWSTARNLRKYPTSKGAVESYKRTFSIAELNEMNKHGDPEANFDETWHARRSWHSDIWEKGTATWDEFTRHFKRHHFESEESWCESVIGARRAMYWDTTNLEVVASGVQWNDISMEIVEMRHATPGPFVKNRVFPELLITASLLESRQFLAISIPLIDFETSEFAMHAKDSSLVVAAYAAIEQFRVLDSGQIEWIMATAVQVLSK